MTAPAVARRAPETVMRLKRLGALHQSRLSFMRILMRRMAREGWRCTRPVFEINAAGVGHAVYTMQGPERAYSLVAFAHDLPDEKRSDRVIAEAWDATFTLFDGVPTAQDIARLAQNVPLQEAGRIGERELSLSRANRSVRLWSHVVGALAEGRQPDPAMLGQVGYLMRTTAVYGSGKFGAADRSSFAARPEVAAPFQIEMLSVYLTRTFVRDLVEHMARAQGGPVAVPLDPALARRLGIGNSTGLGMAPFLINHPVLLNNWIAVREEAIARVRGVSSAEPAAVALLKALFVRARASALAWRSDHRLQQDKLQALWADLDAIETQLAGFDFAGPQPWDALMDWASAALSEEGQEWLASLILEPYGDLVDGLECCLSDSNADAFRINGTQSVADTRALLEASFGWAFDLDWEAPASCMQAWYVSAEKLEPRLGNRFDEPIAPYEQPLAPARDAAAAYHALAAWEDDAPIADFLLACPEHRHNVRRAQMSRVAPYGEIRDNTIAADLLPIDMLRAKLSFFGATHFDPRSDRWVRISMYQGAPYPEDLSPDTADHWIYPTDGA